MSKTIALGTTVTVHGMRWFMGPDPQCPECGSDLVEVYNGSLRPKGQKEQGLVGAVFTCGDCACFWQVWKKDEG